MDNDRLKTIFPFLRNVDLDDPRTKRNVIMICTAGVLFLVLLIAANLKREGAAGTTETQRQSVSTLEIAQGEDKDVLSAESTMDVRESRRQRTDRSLEDIFSSSSAEDDDPMKFLTEERDSPSTGEVVDLSGLEKILKGEVDDGTEESSSFGKDMFPGESSRVKQPRESRSDTPSGRTVSRGDGSRSATTAEQRVAARKRQLMIEAGIDPDTGKPLQDASKTASSGSSGTASASSSGSGSSSYGGSQTSVPAPSAEEARQKEDESVTPRVSVRKSGEISSLGSSRGRSSVGGLGSLKTKDMYVSEDDAHLFKVMFAASEKVSSGQRVTLRLLEDMVVDGMLIPANTFISAIVTIGDRLAVNVNSIELNGKIYTLNYEGYDTDGAKGLYCPRTEKEKVSDEVGREGRNIGRSILSSRIAGTAGLVVSAGASVVESTKGQTTISVTSGYTFFLRQKQRN